MIAKPGAANATSYALVKDVSFRGGVIEVDLAGQPAAGADAGARGFIGIAFRVQGDGRYEYIYLRPTNGFAQAVAFAMSQPDEVDVNEILFRPTRQVLQPGYVIDHIKPLACGGADAPSNMQWQTVTEGKAKDKVERIGCR